MARSGATIPLGGTGERIGADTPALLRPEEGLHFLTVAPRLNGAYARQLAREDVDWKHFADIALSDGTLAAAARALKEMAVAVPDELERSIRNYSAFSDFRLLQAQALLDRTVKALSNAGIQVMLIKGAALASFVYDDFTERNMGDLDLLVAPDDGPRAQQIASESGWRREHPEEGDDEYVEHHHLPPLIDEQGIELQLEIHTDLFPKGHPLKYEVAALRARANTALLGTTKVLVPSLEDMLLYACVHLSWSHEMRSGGWRTFRDIAELIAKPAFSWDRFLGIAAEASVAGSVYWALRLFTSMCRVSIPSGVLARLRPATPSRILDAVEWHFVLQLVPQARVNPSERLSRFLWNLGMRPTLAGHGTIRPWHFADEKLAKTNPKTAFEPRNHWWLQARGLSNAVSYLWLLFAPTRTDKPR